MFTFVSITYKVLSVMNIAVEKDNATSKYFLGSCIPDNEIYFEMGKCREGADN